MSEHNLQSYREDLMRQVGHVPGEEWRNVVTPRFTTDKYIVSNKGRVISLPRWRNSDKGSKVWKGKVLSPSAQRSGHLRVNIHLDGKKYIVHVHRLVMWAFVGPQPPKQYVRHLDGNPANNILENLAYGTPWDNITDTFDPAGATGTGIIIGTSLERRIRSAIQEHGDPINVLLEIEELIKRSKKMNHR